MSTFEGRFTNASELRIAVVVARFNDLVTSKLLSGCLDRLRRLLRLFRGGEGGIVGGFLLLSLSVERRLLLERGNLGSLLGDERARLLETGPELGELAVLLEDGLPGVSLEEVGALDLRWQIEIDCFYGSFSQVQPEGGATINVWSLLEPSNVLNSNADARLTPGG